MTCYFYISGCCNRGNKCSFSHSLECYSSARKLLNCQSSFHNAPVLENNGSIVTDAIEMEKEVLQSSQDIPENCVGINQTVPKFQLPASDVDDNNDDDMVKNASAMASTSPEVILKVQAGSMSPSEECWFRGYPLSREGSEFRGFGL